MHTSCKAQLHCEQLKAAQAYHESRMLQAHTAMELSQHVPVIFFPEAERVILSEATDKEQYKRATKAMRGTMAAVYDRHSQLARLLLDAPVAATCELHPPLWLKLTYLESEPEMGLTECLYRNLERPKFQSGKSAKLCRAKYLGVLVHRQNDRLLIGEGAKQCLITHDMVQGRRLSRRSS